MSNYEPQTNTGNCLFCEIVIGNVQTPGIFWENTNFVAWLAIDPNTEGFSCVVPKQHYASDILKMPDDALRSFIIAAKEVAAILENYFPDVGRVGLLMEGTGVDHAHIKLFPMHGTEHLKHGAWRQFLSGKEIWFDKYEGWISSASGPLADHTELKELAEKIKASIKN